MFDASMDRDSLVARLRASRELPLQRVVVATRLRAGASRLAAELEVLYTHAARGDQDARAATVGVASFVAHVLAAGNDGALASIASAAREADLPLVRVVFADGPPDSALARGGRLAEVGVAVQHSLAVRDGVDRYRMRLQVERYRAHHDPTFIARLLDARWLRVRDAVLIAARRPTVPAMALAIATRDRWMRHAAVREALAANPYTPAQLALALLPSVSESELAVWSTDRASEGVVSRAAAAILRSRHER
jgi:hypothetical protein